MNTPEPEDDRFPKVAGPVVLMGFALMVEAILIFIASIPLLFFAGFGLFGLVGASALMWAGWLLAGLSRGDYRLASIVTAICGIAVAAFSFVIAGMASCASIVNCGSSPSHIALFLVAICLGAFNLVCAFLLWSRR